MKCFCLTVKLKPIVYMLVSVLLIGVLSAAFCTVVGTLDTELIATYKMQYLQHEHTGQKSP